MDSKCIFFICFYPCLPGTCLTSTSSLMKPQVTPPRTSKPKCECPLLLSGYFLWQALVLPFETIWKTVPQWYDRKSRAVFTKLLQIPKYFLLHASSPIVQFSHIWIQTPVLLSVFVLKMLPSCTVDERNPPHKYTQATLIVCRLSATKLITGSFSCMSVFKCDFYSLCGSSSWIKMLYWYQQGLDIYTSSTLVHDIYSNLKLELSCDSFRQM